MSMVKLLNEISKLKHSKVSNVVKSKINTFKKSRTEKEIFKELCFCILTANYSAERSLKIEKEIGDGFLKFPKSKLTQSLSKLGHRFPNTRANYIVRARRLRKQISKVVRTFEPQQLREWLVKNVPGLGYKEASHFLRNIGFENFAIIDFHILDLLERYGIISKPSSLTKRKYFEIEKILNRIAVELSLNLAELDLYLWYMETGRILK